RRVHELDRQPVRIAAIDAVEHCDRLEEEGLAALPMPQPVEPGAAEDRPPRLQALADRFDRGSGAKGKAAEVKLSELEMPDEFPQIPGQDPNRIMFGIMRTATEAVSAQVRHDHPEAGGGNPLGMTELDPVHVGVGEQAVEQDHGSPSADL